MNEFNDKLLLNAAHLHKLKNIEKLLNFKNINTKSQDDREHHGLDPWVQWVSIHTGVPHKLHKVDHLGDVSNLKHPQIWEEVGRRGFSSGIWGAMNASINNAKNCNFFLPDPWTYSQKAKPEKLNNFLALPRFYSKNYLSLPLIRLLKNSLRLVYFIFFQFKLSELVNEIFISLRLILKIGLNGNLLFSLFDLISTKVFLKYKRKFDPNFCIIFLNCLAHAQHEVWKKDVIEKDLLMTLKIVDNILGMIFRQLKDDEALIVLNALGQKNVDGKKYCIYRQIDPEKFLDTLKIKYLSLEQCMTNESHIFFKNKEDKDHALKLLELASINGERLFHIVTYETQQLKLFYQFDYFKALDKGTKFCILDKTYDFYEHFSLLGERTGAHIPFGKAYYSNITMKENINNEKIFKIVLDFFKERHNK
ncbi:hypothetical protein HA152_07400 [Prochlorococcus marinus XMU1412]|nr:hypothetical protein [Prochlorococcus marinus XMU1412]